MMEKTLLHVLHIKKIVDFLTAKTKGTGCTYAWFNFFHVYAHCILGSFSNFIFGFKNLL